VRALALVGNWDVAATLIGVERLGKAIRTAARDAVLPHTAYSMERRRTFGFHEAMDQVGAIVGPLIVAGMLA